jgi:hypothetical protein
MRLRGGKPCIKLEISLGDARDIDPFPDHRNELFTLMPHLVAVVETIAHRGD